MEENHMASFTYFFKLRVDLAKSSSGEELLSKWNEEAQAALGAMDAGIVQVWKDAADTTVYVIMTVEGENAIDAHGTALSIFGTLPMFQSGHLIIEEARSVVPYRDWATYLANRTS